MSNQSFKPGLRPFQRPGIRIEHRGAQALISDAERTKVLSLNESAAAVLELCDGRTTIDEMVMAICQVASVRPDQAREDVELTIAKLEGAGFVAFDPGVGRKRSPRPSVSGSDL
ncbi:MAG TPA: PqqD family protein [Acidimicrobiales bacterium]